MALRSGPACPQHCCKSTASPKFQSVAELKVWALQAGWDERRRAELQALLAPYVVLQSEERIGKQYAYARAESLSAVRPLDPADA